MHSAVLLTGPGGRETDDQLCALSTPARGHHRHRCDRAQRTARRRVLEVRREGLVVLDRITREGCEHLPLRIAGEVRAFDAAALIEERFLVQTDRFSHFAMAATVLALGTTPPALVRVTPRTRTTSA